MMVQVQRNGAGMSTQLTSTVADLTRKASDVRNGFLRQGKCFATKGEEKKPCQGSTTRTAVCWGEDSRNNKQFLEGKGTNYGSKKRGDWGFGKRGKED